MLCREELVVLFDDAKVGGFLYACKFFFEFLMGIWRLARDNATEGTRGGWNCRVGDARGECDGIALYGTKGMEYRREGGFLTRIIAKGHELFAT